MVGSAVAELSDGAEALVSGKPRSSTRSFCKD